MLTQLFQSECGFSGSYPVQVYFFKGRTQIFLTGWIRIRFFFWGGWIRVIFNRIRNPDYRKPCLSKRQKLLWRETLMYLNRKWPAILQLIYSDPEQEEYNRIRVEINRNQKEPWTRYKRNGPIFKVLFPDFHVFIFYLYFIWIIQIV